MNQNQMQSKPNTVQEPRNEGLDETTCSAVIRQIPKTPQSQHALCDQLSLLWAAASRLGLYDAADFIRPHMAGNFPPNDERTHGARKEGK